ncbi:MAG: YdcF family protein [Bryobacteraceae bacterium]|jgi:uncharacterized SAM-binding protein YcdF (DUF218 family)
MVRDIGRRLWRAAVRLLATVGLLFVLVTLTPFVSWYATKLARPWSSYRGDVLVVLSGSEPNVGVGFGPNVNVMDASTYWRCFMALLYYREHPYAQIIVSGKDSAPGMRDFFVFNGIPADRIRVEDKATSTHENAEFTARMLAGTTGRIVLLTSDSHMFRARRCFVKEGVGIAASAVPDVIKRAGDYSARPQLFIGEVRETASIVYYWYRGWI